MDMAKLVELLVRFAPGLKLYATYASNNTEALHDLQKVHLPPSLPPFLPPSLPPFLLKSSPSSTTSFLPPFLPPSLLQVQSVLARFLSAHPLPSPSFHPAHDAIEKILYLPCVRLPQYQAYVAELMLFVPQVRAFLPSLRPFLPPSFPPSLPPSFACLVSAAIPKLCC